MTPESNDKVYDTVSQIWPRDPRMNEQQARATFAHLEPEGRRVPLGGGSR